MSETPSERPGLDTDGPRAAAPGDPGATIPLDTDGMDPTDPQGREGTPIPPSKGYREVTLLAVVVGVLIGVVMNASITYAGLKIGFTIGGSAIAAVLPSCKEPSSTRWGAAKSRASGAFASPSTRATWYLLSSPPGLVITARR